MAGRRSEELVRQINACVDRMRAVTPDEPYVLSIPQDEPKYHHHSRHSADLWLHCTPFRRDDHPNQQYQTFYYHEPLSDVFHLHRNSFYHREHGDQLPARDAPNPPSSSQSTPSMLPKKKISLAAYANKKAQPDKPDVKHHHERIPDSPDSSQQSTKSHDSANLPRMLSPLHMPKPHAQKPLQQHPPPRQSHHLPPRPASPAIPPRPVSPTLPARIIADLDANPYQPSYKHASKRPPSPLPPPPDKARKQPANIPDPNTRDTPQEPQEQEPLQPSLIVKLKIPKSMRKNICRYLQMKPQRTIPDPPPEKPPASSSALKRPRAAEEDVPQPDPKRKKPIKVEPAIKQESSTPAPATPAAQKDTPTARNNNNSSNKDLRTSVAMKRVESTDSIANGTPPSSRRPNAKVKPSPSNTNTKTSETLAWEAESARIGKLGRELKHAASDSAQKTRNDQTSSLAAAQSLESFLCFILSFYCRERGFQSRNPPSPLDPTHTWLTLPAFIKFVRTHCHGFPVLEGLACHLGVVCNAMIMLRLTSKRSSDLTPEESRALHDAVSAGLKASHEASSKLPLKALTKNFPDTWKKGLDASAATKTADEDVKPGKFAGPFSLPLGLDTEPIVAVRVGCALLAEWCRAKGLGYAMKLSL